MNVLTPIGLLRLLARALAGLGILAALGAPSAHAQRDLQLVTSVWSQGSFATQDDDFDQASVRAATSIRSDATASGIGNAVDLQGRIASGMVVGEVGATASAKRLTVTANSQANANSDPLHQAGLGFSTGNDGSARASANVPFKVDSAGLAGTHGRLVVPFIVWGDLTIMEGVPLVFPFGSSAGFARVGFDVDVLPSHPACTNRDRCFELDETVPPGAARGPGVVGSYLAEFRFRFGDWSNFSYQIDTQLNTRAWARSLSDVLGDTKAMQATSFHSIAWGGNPQVFDANGNRVSVFSLTSLPGIDLMTTGVPEPATWALMLAGVGLLLWRRRLAR